jgi:hypothetical protein
VPAARNYPNEVADPTAPDGEFVLSLCRCLLHREPSAPGLALIVEKLKAGRPRSEIIVHLFLSQAYQGRKTSHAEYARDLYQGLFGREPNRWEAKIIVDYLNGGGKRDVALTTLLSSAEYKALSRKPHRPAAPSPPVKVPPGPAAKGPPAAANLQVLYQQCVDAYNHLVRLMASKPVDAKGLADVRQARDDYLQARKRYEDALPR